jgi:hypothetical protein
VDLTEGRSGRFGERVYLHSIGDVDDAPLDAGALRLELARGRGERVRLHVGEHETHAEACAGSRELSAQARARSRDHRDLVL